MRNDENNRVVRLEFTDELLQSYSNYDDVSHDKVEKIIEEKAEYLERSMDCVIKINKPGRMPTFRVECYYTRAAEPDIIKHGVKQLQSEIMRELNGDDTYWGGVNTGPDR